MYYFQDTAQRGAELKLTAAEFALAELVYMGNYVVDVGKKQGQGGEKYSEVSHKIFQNFYLLQLYLDAVPYFGSLDFLKECFTQEDVKRAVRVGACNVFHAALHNFLHARDRSTIKDIYKAARFVVRLKHYRDTGVYVPEMKELIKVAGAEDNCILAICGQPFAGNDENEFAQKSKTLIEWAGNIIKNEA